jgi:hypothetical protein
MLGLPQSSIRAFVFVVVVGLASAGSAAAGASTGGGAGPMTAVLGASRYGSGITYSMIGPLVVGTDVYAGAFSINQSWGPAGGITATIQGNANGKTLSGPCASVTGAPAASQGINTFTCAVDLDGSTANLTFELTMVETGSSQTGPSDYTYTFAGAYTAD